MALSRRELLPLGQVTEGKPGMQAPERSGGGPRANTPLRLTVAGGALGLEVYAPVELRPLSVNEASWSLSGLRFPIDLSGGVAKFRHRRGQLQRLALTAPLAGLQAYAQARLRSTPDHRSLELSLWPQATGLGVGVVEPGGALAFDLSWLPAMDDVKLLVHRARGAGGDVLPLARALRLVDRVFSNYGRRHGRRVTLERAAGKLGRALAATLGFRAPDSREVQWAGWEASASTVSVSANHLGAPPLLAEGLVAELELASRLAEADTELTQGRLESARRAYLHASAEAPQQRETAELLAQIDLAHEARGEAALQTLEECGGAEAFGFAGGLALARAGLRRAAARAVEAAAAEERFAPLAAELWAALGGWESGAGRRLDWLNLAVAACPSHARVRWARLETRLRVGDVAGAIADAEHLEAASGSERQRGDRLCEAGRAVVAAGFTEEAGQLFRRALKYRPQDPDASLGLARALVMAGEAKRAIQLLHHAVEQADQEGKSCHAARVDLARALAGRLGDHSQAIARVREIPRTADEYLEAKALEGHWRGVLGDLAGASIAFGALLEECVRRGPDAQLVRAASPWLVEAAQLERELQNNPGGAKCHIEFALRSAPTDPQLRRLYRELSEEQAQTAKQAETANGTARGKPPGS